MGSFFSDILSKAETVGNTLVKTIQSPKFQDALKNPPKPHFSTSLPAPLAGIGQPSAQKPFMFSTPSPVLLSAANSLALKQKPLVPNTQLSQGKLPTAGANLVENLKGIFDPNNYFSGGTENQIANRAQAMPRLAEQVSNDPLFLNSINNAVARSTGFNFFKSWGDALNREQSTEAANKPVVPIKGPTSIGNVKQATLSQKIASGFASGSPLFQGSVNAGQKGATPTAGQAAIAPGIYGGLALYDGMVTAKLAAHVGMSLLEDGVNAIKFKNVSISPEELKSALGEVTSGAKGNASPAAISAAKNLIQNAQKGKSLIQQVNEGATVKVQRDFLGWVKNFFHDTPKETLHPEIQGLLESISTMPKSPAKVEEAVNTAMSLFQPQNDNFAHIVPSLSNLGKFAQLKGGKSGTPGIDYPAPVPEQPEAFSPEKYVQDLTTKQEAAKTGETPKIGIKQKISNTVNTAQRLFEDAAAPIEKMISANEKKYGYQILPSQHFSPAYDNALRSTEAAKNFLQTSGFVKTLSTIPKNQDKAFQQYLIARQVQDLTPEQQAATGRDLSKDQQLLAHYKDQFEPLAAQHTAVANQLLDYAVEKGLVDPEVAKKIKNEYGNYAPINRIFSELEDSNPAFAPNKAPASVGSQHVLQKRGISSRVIEDPSVNLIHKVFTAFNEGERNDVATKLIDLGKLPGWEGTFKPLQNGEKPGHGEEIVSRMVNGTRENYAVPKDIADFAKAYDVKELGIIEKAVNAVGRIFKVGTTGINIVFAAKNLIKDIQTAAVNVKGSGKGLLNPKIWKDAFGAATGVAPEATKEINQQNIIGTSFDPFRSSDKGIQDYSYVKSQKNLLTKSVYNITHPSQWLKAVEDIVSVTERATRNNIYFTKKAAYQKAGYSEKNAKILATQDARNGTANFIRGGSLSRQLSVAGPYVRAAIRGAAAFRKGWQDQGPASTIAKLVAYGAVPVIALTAWNTGTDDRKKAYDSISDVDKQNYFIWIPPIPIKDDKGKWIVVKIPKSQEISALMAPLEKMVSGNTDNITGTIFQAIEQPTIGIDASNPIATLLPQIGKGFIENRSGKGGYDYYFKSSIVPQSLQGVSPEEQYVPGKTSATARGLAKIAGTLGLEEGSPLKMEHLIQSYGGAAAMQALNLSDQAAVLMGIIKPPDVGGSDIGAGLTSSFARVSGNEDINKAYTAKNIADTKTATTNLKIKRQIDELYSNPDQTARKQGLTDYFQTLPDDRQKYADKYLGTLLKFQNTPKEAQVIQSMNGTEAVEYWKNDIQVAMDDYYTGDKVAAKAKLKGIEDYYAKKPSTLKALDSYIGTLMH